MEKNGPCEARALIAVVNDYVFVDKIYSRDASRMGQAGTFWTGVSLTPAVNHSTRWTGKVNIGPLASFKQ